MRRLVVTMIAAIVAAAAASAAATAPKLAYGLQDDAWIQYGPGTIESRIETLRTLGIRVVRVTVRWDQVETEQGTFDWTTPDAVLGPLEQAGIEPVVTLYGTPGWANGVRAPNVAPTRGSDFADFAAAIADRYPTVHKWTIWNEPNQRRWLSTASPVQYVTRLLNPAYVAIHDVSPSSRVAGGVTAPRGGAGGTSPVSFIRGMGRAGARLDAYAHHPYALSPSETPWSGGCAHCQTITLSTIDKLVDRDTEGVRPAGAALADRARLPVESARQAGRRAAADTGDLRRGCGLSRLAHPARRPAHPVPLPRRARHGSVAERARDEDGAGQARDGRRPPPACRGRAPRLEDHRLGDDPTRQRRAALPPAAAR